MFGKVKEENFQQREEHGLKGGDGSITIYEALYQHEQPDVLEHGFLLVPVGASIGMHEHNKDWESWEIIMGRVSYLANKNEPEEIGPGVERICLIGEKHGLKNIGDCDAVIKFTKYR